MSNVQQFIQELQSIVQADKTVKCYHYALKYLNDNGYRTVRDIPEESRESFLALVRAAPDA